jgi:hypothetical protein
MAALDAVRAIVPAQKIHAAGIAWAERSLRCGRRHVACVDDRLATVTLLAAQTDLTEPGELALFIDDSQMHFLESMMWNRGYLSDDQMAGAFHLLRTNDLIWSRHIHDYLMGRRRPLNDLMAWNADSTRMPYRMHAEYLQRLYLDNELAAGRFLVDGRPAAVQNIRAPFFVVGTERDHVAPWLSVYKIHYLSDTDVTFVLTSGGHNASIVSEPGRPGRRYRVSLKRESDACLGPEEWADQPPKDGLLVGRGQMAGRTLDEGAGGCRGWSRAQHLRANHRCAWDYALSTMRRRSKAGGRERPAACLVCGRGPAIGSPHCRCLQKFSADRLDWFASQNHGCRNRSKSTDRINDDRQILGAGTMASRRSSHRQ